MNLQSSFSTSQLFYQIENISDRKNLCNVEIHCSNGILYHNKLLVGLLFPVLEVVEEFIRKAEVVIIIQGETVQSIEEKFDQCFKSIHEEKVENEQNEDVQNVDVQNEDVQNILFPDAEQFIKADFDDPMSTSTENTKENDPIKEVVEKALITEMETEKRVATKVEEEEEFQKLVNYFTAYLHSFKKRVVLDINVTFVNIHLAQLRLLNT